MNNNSKYLINKNNTTLNKKNNTKLNKKKNIKLNKRKNTTFKKKNIIILCLYLTVFILLCIICFFSQQLYIKIPKYSPNDKNINELNFGFNLFIDNINTIINNSIEPIKTINSNINFEDLKIKNIDLYFDISVNSIISFNTIQINLNYIIKDKDIIIIQNSFSIKYKIQDISKEKIDDLINKIMELLYEHIIISLLLYIINTRIINTKQNDKYKFIDICCLLNRAKTLDIDTTKYDDISNNNLISKIEKKLNNNDDDINKIISILNNNNIFNEINTYVSNLINVKEITTCYDDNSNNKCNINYIDNNSKLKNLTDIFNYDIIKKNVALLLNLDEHFFIKKVIKLFNICILSLFGFIIILKLLLIYKKNILITSFYHIISWLFFIIMLCISIALLIPKKITKLINKNIYNNYLKNINLEIKIGTLLPLLATILILIIKII